MYAIVRTGGKQYRVAEGDVVRVEKLEVEVGQKLELSEVLMLGEGEAARVGAPLLPGAKVLAEVVSHGRGKKIHIVKKKRRKNYRRHTGHRQDFTALKITGIAEE